MSDIQAALAGWFTLDNREPCLLGSQCNDCGTYYFPKHGNFCKNPNCHGETFNQVPLSRTGKIWSFTNAAYQPPSPYISPEPFEPFAIAAVELARENMIVLGQMVKGVDSDDLQVGMEVELVLETLYRDEEGEKVIWKWQPLGEASV